MAAAAAAESDLIARIRGEVESLARDFEGLFSRESIQRVADESYLRLRSARVIEYVPLLVYRFTRERLTALAQVQGLMTKEQPEILFVCVHNAGRSQMAAVLAAHLSGGRVHVRSAGSMPADEINPAVVRAMQEIGLDLSEEFPKPLTDEFVRAADVVVTMGCGDACALYPGTRYLDWQLDDPAGQPIEDVRRIRDEIAERVRGLLGELGIEAEQRSGGGGGGGGGG
ncbi:MAG: arsenate reductase ArsC, partial [Dehalococcoidia bacterium]